MDETSDLIKASYNNNIAKRDELVREAYAYKPRSLKSASQVWKEKGRTSRSVFFRRWKATKDLNYSLGLVEISNV